MKIMFFVLAIAVTIMTACNSTGKESNEVKNPKPEILSDSIPLHIKSNQNAKDAGPFNEIINAYLKLENALAEDNSAGAATAGKKLETAFKNFDKSALSANQRKVYEDLESDAREHAEHIGANSGNIKHQREHFELLSKDINGLEKLFGDEKDLYK